MKSISVFTVCVIVAVSSADSRLTSPGIHKNSLVDVRRRAEEFYRTLPKEIQEDAKLSIPDLIQKYGYPCQTHTLTTPDGYILEIHRIPHGRNGPSIDRPAILLQHGLGSSSADWVIPGPGKGLAYILAEAGYDVWMSNARGTRYSRKHIHLEPDVDKREFFNFSWHEIATLDLPATIDYITAQTKQDEIFYIGHSQGTTVSYVLLSEKPEYNSRFRSLISFAPTAYLTHMKSYLRFVAPHVKVLETMCNVLGMYEASSADESFAEMGHLRCSDDSIFQILCTNYVFALFGYNPDQMNATLLPLIMEHTPAGASLLQELHYGQVFKSERFQQWDYGRRGNQEHYGSDSPPAYQLENIKAPFHLFYSTNDLLGNVTDVMRLYNQLSNAKLHLVPDSKFNHVDYLYAIDAPTLVYEKVLRLLKEY